MRVIAGKLKAVLREADDLLPKADSTQNRAVENVDIREVAIELFLVGLTLGR